MENYFSKGSRTTYKTLKATYDRSEAQKHTYVCWSCFRLWRSVTFAPVARFLSLSSLSYFFPRFSSTGPAKISPLIQIAVLSFVEFRRGVNSEGFPFANGLNVAKRPWRCLTFEASLRLILFSCLETFTRNVGPPHEEKQAATKLQIKAINRPEINRPEIKQRRIENISCPSPILMYALWRLGKISTFLKT